ncbi:MAG: NAD-binding protein [Acidobacteriota bacterium]
MGIIRRRMALVGLGVLAVLAFGTIGFVLIEGYSPFDAFYMTLTTVTTVGYGEIHPLSTAGRVFNAILIMVGVTIILLAMGAMTQTVIELELNNFFGKRRTRNMIDKLEGHIILCGFGRVGRGAAAVLSESNTPFVVVDHNEDRVERAIKLGMLAVLADASRDDTLRLVGIARAKGLIATLRSDPDNLFVVLTAKSLNPNLELSARVAEESTEAKMRRAGATHVFAPYVTTGHRMAQALLKPHVLQFLDHTTHAGVGLDVGIEQVRVESSCRFCNRALTEMNMRQETGVILLAVRNAEGHMRFNPSPEYQLADGDYLIVMGEADGLKRLESMLLEGTK